MQCKMDGSLYQKTHFKAIKQDNRSFYPKPPLHG